MPKLGLGTWPIAGAACQAAVESALGLGYRHLDTSEMYGNEGAVGAGMAGSGVPRGDIHLTTNVWTDHLAPARMRAAMDASLQALRTNYVDLYLIHWPSPHMDLPAALETLMALQQDGKARRIGVANFNVALLKRAIEEVRAPIAAHQFEYHALLRQPPLLAYMRAHGVPAIAYSPLAKGELIRNEALIRIARKHDATPAQVAIKWLLDQENVAAIPKSSRREGQAENLRALDMQLDEDDRAAIDALPKNRRMVNAGFAPSWDGTG
ncbi:MAG: aldo/keto reductase [Pseudomonadota bacterium]|nr:aldo/keto reductase [Pseudomonadota bacterium]